MARQEPISVSELILMACLCVCITHKCTACPVNSSALRPVFTCGMLCIALCCGSAACASHAVFLYWLAGACAMLLMYIHDTSCSALLGHSYTYSTIAQQISALLAVLSVRCCTDRINPQALKSMQCLHWVDARLLCQPLWSAAVLMRLYHLKCSRPLKMLLMLLRQTLSSSSSTCDYLGWITIAICIFICGPVFVTACHHCNDSLTKPRLCNVCYLHAASISDWFIAMLRSLEYTCSCSEQMLWL